MIFIKRLQRATNFNCPPLRLRLLSWISSEKVGTRAVNNKPTERERERRLLIVVMLIMEITRVNFKRKVEEGGNLVTLLKLPFILINK